MISREEITYAERCLESTLEKGAQQARITLNKSTMDLVGTLNGEVDKVSHCLDRSLSINLFVDGRFGSFSTNRFDLRELDAFLDRAVGMTRMLQEDPCRALPDPARTARDAQEGRELGLYDGRYEAVTASSRVERALSASVYAEGRARGLVSEEGEYSDNAFDTLVIDSQVTRCRHTETSFEYGVEMTVEDTDGHKYTGYWWDASSREDGLDLAGCGPKALRRALAQMHPQEHPGGRNHLVNALSGYSIQQNNSFLRDSLGQMVFPEGLTILDDCRTPGQTGCRLFDSEGVATRVHPIIEQGVVKEYFINTYMAGKLRMAPTIEDATRPRIPGWPKPGLGRDELLALCGEGIFVTGFNGGNSNSSTGDFSYGIEGFAFRDGKLLHPVHEMVMTGNFITLWKHLVAIADDARPCMSKLIPTLAFSNVDFSA